MRYGTALGPQEAAISLLGLILGVLGALVFVAAAYQFWLAGERVPRSFQPWKRNTSREQARLIEVRRFQHRGWTYTGLAIGMSVASAVLGYWF